MTKLKRQRRSAAPSRKQTGAQKRTWCIVAGLSVLICCNIAVLSVLLQRQSNFVQQGLLSVSTAQLSAVQQQEQAQKVAEDMQLLSVNAGPHFVLPDGEGDVRIEVAAGCHYAYRATYLLAATQEQILETGLINPGEYVLKKSLDAALEAGKYDVLALFTAYDLQTRQPVGRAAQAITVSIDAAAQ